MNYYNEIKKRGEEFTLNDAKHQFRRNNMVVFAALTFMLLLMNLHSVTLSFLNYFTESIIKIISNSNGVSLDEAEVLFNNFYNSSFFNLVLSITCQVIMLAVPSLFAVKFMAKRPKKAVPLKPVIPEKPFSFILISLGLCYCVNMIFSLIFRADELFNIKLDVNGYITTFLTVAVVAPIFEEIFFRGALMQSLIPFNRIYAILATGAAFGILHREKAMVVNALVFGLVAGIGLIKTKSLFICIVLHAVNNSLALLSTLLLENIYTKYYALLISIYIISAIGFAIMFIVNTFIHKKASVFALPAEDSDIPRIPRNDLCKIALSNPFLWLFTIAMTLVLI